MPADITRFDFHVVRFLSSETVKEMTAEEVGQYILLLCDAWLLSKGATLPDNSSYLARTARCGAVSELVMSKFPIVETEYGSRRRNDTLYGEWLLAVERSASASERGKIGNDARWGTGTSASSTRISDNYRDPKCEPSAISLKSPKPSQFKPSQPNQTKPTNPESQFDSGGFKNIRTHWYSYFKKNLSNSKRNHEQYAEACGNHSEDRVLQYLETWAKNNQWVLSHPKGENRLYVFLDELPNMIAGDEMRNTLQSKSTKVGEVDQSLVDKAIQDDDSAIRAKKEKLREKREQDAEFAASTRGQI